jgi:hypothetical protein
VAGCLFSLDQVRTLICSTWIGHRWESSARMRKRVRGLDLNATTLGDPVARIRRQYGVAKQVPRRRLDTAHGSR